MKIQKNKGPKPLLLTILIISICTLFLSVRISYKQFQSVTISEKLVIHSHEIIQTVHELLTYVKDAETAQRGYILTKDTVFLESYTNSSNKAKLTINKFNTLLIHDIRQIKNIDSLDLWINQRFQISASSLQKQNIVLPLSDLNKTLLLSRKKLIDKIHNKTIEIINLETTKLKTREANYLEEVGISPIIFLLTIIFSLIIFVGAFYKIYKDMSILNNTNNQMLINKELFSHNEAIANTSSWFFDIEENKIEYSDNLYCLLGCEPNEFEPSLENFLKFVHPEDKNIIIDETQKVNEGIISSITYFRIIRKDGQIRYFKSLGKIITDANGKNIAIGINADITEEYLANKILEEKLFDLEQSKD